MHGPGVEVRPLRELSGRAAFNEVFLSDCFVADDHVVGRVNDGWHVARTTLDNERVSMAGGSPLGHGIEGLLALVASSGDADEPWVLDRLGALVAEARTLAILSLRSTQRALEGAKAGTEASIRKLVRAEHEQRIESFGLELLGSEGAAATGAARAWSEGYLMKRCLTIAGGTSEIQRNILAERALDLPRDAE
jgi:alkylation response protein AidB-like acyl-CoA dehydrogenase